MVFACADHKMLLTQSSNMQGRAEPARAKAVEAMLEWWRSATYREKEILIEQIRQEALRRIKSACESLTDPASRVEDRHAS